MADYYRKTTLIMKDNNCYLASQGKGDHEKWFSPITDKHIVVPFKLKSRQMANVILKQAGISERI